MTLHIDRRLETLPRLRPWKRAFAIVIVLLLGASVGHAQGTQPSSNMPGYFQPSVFAQRYGAGGGPIIPSGPLYVSCWAEAPSPGPAYFSATFRSHAPWKSRKEFRELVATRYGSVSRARCAGNTSLTKLEELVQQRKDDARATTTNTIVDTGWEP